MSGPDFKFTCPEHLMSIVEKKTIYYIVMELRMDCYKLLYWDHISTFWLSNYCKTTNFSGYVIQRFGFSDTLAYIGDAQ